MNEPAVSLVVLSWNGMEHLDLCLSSLSNQTYSDYEILLVDNGSSDGSKEWVEAHYPQVRIERTEQNLGVPGGVNFGLARARGRYVAILNNDLEAEPQWLAASVGALEQYPEAGFTASRVRLFYQRERLDTAGDLYFSAGYPAKRGWLHRDGPEFDEPRWVFGACAVAALYRRELLEAVGFMDEDFESGLEDLDLSFRAQLRGYKCRYVPSAIIYHKLGATVGKGLTSPKHLLRFHRNIWLVRIKNLPSWFWLRYLPQMLVAELVVLFRAMRSGRLGLLLQARREVLHGLHQTLAKRRVIQGQRTVSNRDLHRVIESGWLAYRMREKRLEAEVESTSP